MYRIRVVDGNFVANAIAHLNPPRAANFRANGLTRTYTTKYRGASAAFETIDPALSPRVYQFLSTAHLTSKVRLETRSASCGLSVGQSAA